MLNSFQIFEAHYHIGCAYSHELKFEKALIHLNHAVNTAVRVVVRS